MPNFSSLAGLEVAEKFVWGGGGVCTVIFMSNPTVVLCCVEVGVLTKNNIFKIGDFVPARIPQDPLGFPRIQRPKLKISTCLNRV